MISRSWNGFDGMLAKYHTVYVPELPGFGASEAVPGCLHNTDLFAKALCAFVRENRLQQAPLIALSLGTIVALKAAAAGTVHGPLILVGMPVKTESAKLKNASRIPVALRRLICSTVWGREYILLPVLRDILGTKPDAQGDAKLLEDLQSTDTRALVDLNVAQEIQEDIPAIMPNIPNEIWYIYGSEDNLLKDARVPEDRLRVVKGARHNVFSSRPEKLMPVLRQLVP
jgi:pimeloyl-ACP methyl ester carboxylesterase